MERADSDNLAIFNIYSSRIAIAGEGTLAEGFDHGFSDCGFLLGLFGNLSGLQSVSAGNGTVVLRTFGGKTSIGNHGLVAGFLVGLLGLIRGLTVVFRTRHGSRVG